MMDADTQRRGEREAGKRTETGVRYYCPLSISPVTELKGGRKTVKRNA